MDPFFHTGLSISDSLKTVRKSVLIYETIIKEAQVLTISFNQNVTYVSGGAGLISGNGTPTLKVKLSYHQNPTDNIGFGDLVVTSDAGLSISSVSITD